MWWCQCSGLQAVNGQKEKVRQKGGGEAESFCAPVSCDQNRWCIWGRTFHTVFTTLCRMPHASTTASTAPVRQYGALKSTDTMMREGKLTKKSNSLNESTVIGYTVFSPLSILNPSVFEKGFDGDCAVVYRI